MTNLWLKYLEKADLFNEFFTQQCNTIENDSAVSNDINFETEILDISKDKIIMIIKSLDPNKTHGHSRKSSYLSGGKLI